MSKDNRLRTLQILHIALVGGLLLFAGFAYYLNSGPGLDADYALQGGPMKWFVPLGMAFLLGLAFLINRRRLASAPAGGSVELRWNHYRTTCLIRWAMVEGAVFLSLVFYLLDEEWSYLLYGLAGLAILGLWRPEAGELERHYRLRPADLD